MYDHLTSRCGDTNHHRTQAPQLSFDRRVSFGRRVEEEEAAAARTEQLTTERSAPARGGVPAVDDRCCHAR
jgi:hypothetical protein